MLYYIGRAVFSIYLKIFYRLTIHNADNIPGRKPFIICSNHISWLDPLAVAAALPASYRIHFMAKKELFNNFITSFLFRKVYAFPVNRQDADFGAIKKAYQLLKEEQVLGLFPEGTRSRNSRMSKAYNGAALISVRSGVPVLPVAIVGPYRLFRRINVFIGHPFVLPPLIYEQKNKKKEQLEEMSEIIMKNIGILMPEKSLE